MNKIIKIFYDKYLKRVNNELDEKFNLDLPGNNENQIVEIVETLPDNWRNDELIEL